MPLHPVYVPHGPEEGAGGRFVAPPPCYHIHGAENYLSNLYLRKDVTDLQDFANILHSEPDAAHYLNDSRHQAVSNDINQLSVKLSSLQAEHEHYVNEHWIPMQCFASGVVSALGIPAGEPPESPSFCHRCEGGVQSVGSPIQPRPWHPPPTNLSIITLQPSILYNSPQQSSDSLSVPGLKSVTSSSYSSLLYSPPSSYVDVESCEPSSPMSFHTQLLRMINYSDWVQR